MPLNISVDKFEEYLIQKNLKKRTIENYLFYFYKYEYDAFNQEGIARFLSKSEHRNNNARAFLANIQKFLKLYGKELGISQIAQVDITNAEIPKLTGRKKQVEINPIPHDWIPKLEEALETEKDKLKLLMSYYCGLRVGELMSIRITSFNWEKWKTNTQAMGECKVIGKGDKEGVAFVPSFLMVRMARYLKNTKFKAIDSRIFSHNKENANDKYRPREWQRVLHEAGIKCGYTKLNEEGKPLNDTETHPHKLRHSYASHLLDKGMDIRKIQIILRHTSITSTQIYTHVNKDKLKEEINEKLFG